MPYKCGWCGKLFSRQSGLIQHIQVQHSRKEPFKCAYCDKFFSNKATLASHIGIHKGQNSHSIEEPYKCAYCDKFFFNKATLASHIGIHKGENSYECKQCNQSFSKKLNWDIHIMKHVGMPYRCEICDKQFSDKNILSIHKYVHGGEQPNKSSLGEQTFVQTENVIKSEIKHEVEYDEHEVKSIAIDPLNFQVNSDDQNADSEVDAPPVLLFDNHKMGDLTEQIQVEEIIENVPVELKRREHEPALTGDDSYLDPDRLPTKEQIIRRCIWLKRHKYNVRNTIGEMISCPRNSSSSNMQCKNGECSGPGASVSWQSKPAATVSIQPKPTKKCLLRQIVNTFNAAGFYEEIISELSIRKRIENLYKSYWKHLQDKYYLQRRKEFDDFMKTSSCLFDIFKHNANKIIDADTKRYENNKRKDKLLIKNYKEGSLVKIGDPTDYADDKNTTAENVIDEKAAQMIVQIEGVKSEIKQEDDCDEDDVKHDASAVDPLDPFDSDDQIEDSEVPEVINDNDEMKDEEINHQNVEIEGSELKHTLTRLPSDREAFKQEFDNGEDILEVHENKIEPQSFEYNFHL